MKKVRQAATRTSARQGTHPARRSSRNKKRPNYRLLFSFFFMSLVLSCAVTFALRTPNLEVKEVKIKGVNLCDRQIVDKYACSMEGKSILSLSKAKVCSAISGIHEVEDVKIGRSLPDKMWVQVIERKPVAIISDGQSFCMIQNDGLVFHRTTGPAKNIPLIEISNNEKLQPGKTAYSDQVRCALEVVKLAQSKKLKINKISIDHDGDICLNMVSGFYVKLGQPEDIARKMSLLRSALVYRPSIAGEAKYIDLSCPSAPVWKPKVDVRNAT